MAKNFGHQRAGREFRNFGASKKRKRVPELWDIKEDEESSGIFENLRRSRVSKFWDIKPEAKSYIV